MIRELTLVCEEDGTEWTAKFFVDKGDRWTPPCIELDDGDDHCPECGVTGEIVDTDPDDSYDGPYDRLEDKERDYE